VSSSAATARPPNHSNFAGTGAIFIASHSHSIPPRAAESIDASNYFVPPHRFGLPLARGRSIVESLEGQLDVFVVVGIQEFPSAMRTGDGREIPAHSGGFFAGLAAGRPGLFIS
jgi:hypothetical protein